MKNVYDFSSDNVNVFLMVIDSSGSMSSSKDDVKKGIRAYKRSFEGFEESGSIAVAVSYFSSDYYGGDFRRIEEISEEYEIGGATALYYAINKGKQQLTNYMDEIERRMGVIPRGTFIYFSDGEPCEDMATRESAKNSIREMNIAGITTAFVAFGKAITSNFGKELGFQSTIDVSDKKKLTKFMGGELSKSCKEQSRSMKALSGDFFSKAAGSENSEGYSRTTAQVLNDDSWINEI